MSRWHLADCQAPDVRVEDNVPHCWACGAAPHLESIVAAASKSSSLPHIPPDEPLDQMNLWWPPSMPYTREDTSEDRVGPQEPLEHRDLAVAHPAHVFAREESDCATAPVNSEEEMAHTRESRCGHEPKPVPAIYATPLAPDHFRLLCLHAPPSVQQDFPIHCDLGTFPLDDCPEYEAMSYAWGGENGDSTKRCPIYIGPYWDVLVQTQNCSDMLRHIRPLRGFRLVWVDAICINQEDDSERSSQIACMARIYGLCLRVVVYLGQDLCSPLPAGRSHPHRAGLETLSDLSGVLGRKYFSRVWVIQELVLPKDVMLRVGSTDYKIHASTFANHKIPEMVPAHWIRYATKGMLAGDGIVDIIPLTWESCASDPRDRIFGILGLLEDDTSGSLPSPRLDLTADYGLSPQHVFTGLFAYLIVRMGSSKILAAAVGIKGWGQMPSWMPDWQADVHSRPRSFGQNMTRHPDELHHLSGIPMNYSRREDSVFSMSLREVVAGVPDPELIPWDHGIRVDARTARLQVALVHIMPVPSLPNLIAVDEGLCTYWLPVGTGEDYGVVIMKNGELNCRLEPGLDHFFVLDHGDGACTHLILRPSSSKITTLPTLNSYGNDCYLGAGDRQRCLSWGGWRVVAVYSRIFLAYSSYAEEKLRQGQAMRTRAHPLTSIHLGELRVPRSQLVRYFAAEIRGECRESGGLGDDAPNVFRTVLTFEGYPDDRAPSFLRILLGSKGFTAEGVVCLIQAIIEQDMDENKRGIFGREFMRLADPRMEPQATASHLSWTVWYWKVVPAKHSPAYYDQLLLPNFTTDGTYRNGGDNPIQTPEQKQEVFASNVLGNVPFWSAVEGFNSSGANAPIVKATIDRAITAIKVYNSWLYGRVEVLSAVTRGEPLRALTSGPTPEEELMGFPGGMSLDEATAFRLNGSTYSIGLI
ncbi:hypothetical protein RB601_009006 [Gaeumannomyces tritici]